MEEPDLDRNIRENEERRVKRTENAKLTGFIAVVSILAVPLMLLIHLFETVYALAVVIAIFGLSIAGFKIYHGQYGWSTIAWGVGSLFILLLHFVIAPLVLRKTQKKKRAI